jgi:hypothetical protein
MPMVTAALVAGGGQLLGSMMQGQASAAQAEAQRLQFEEAQFNRKWQNQIQNREIAKANAIQWMNNKKIAEAANQERAETEFYLKYNFNNETGELSRQYKQVNDQITASLYSKGIDPSSGTGRALMYASMNRAKKVFGARRINLETGLISAERKQQQQLAQRNFGYNSHIPLMQEEYRGPKGKDIMRQALVSGLVQGAAAGYGAWATTDFQQKQLALLSGDPE